jgi:hypothetical protein
MCWQAGYFRRLLAPRRAAGEMVAVGGLCCGAYSSDTFPFALGLNVPFSGVVGLHQAAAMQCQRRTRGLMRLGKVSCVGEGYFFFFLPAFFFVLFAFLARCASKKVNDGHTLACC